MADDRVVSTPSKGWDAARAKWRCLQSPESQDKWKMVTAATLQDARSLTRDMWKQLQEQGEVEGNNPAPLSRVTGRSMKQGGGKPRPLDQSALVVGPQAVVALHAGIDECRRVEKGLHQVIEQVRECHLRAQHAQRARWSAIKVNEWRWELRTRRPEQEKFDDHLQQALHEENTTLHAARKELGELVAEVAQMQEALESARKRVVRRLTMNQLPNTALCKHKDWGLFSATSQEGETNRPETPKKAQATGQDPGGEPGSPSSVPSSPQGGLGSSPSSPSGVARLENQEELLSHAAALSKAAGPDKLGLEQPTSLISRVDAAIPRCEKACEKAMAAVSSSLGKRTEETRQIRAELEGQLDEMTQAIKAAETSIFRSQARHTTANDGVVSGKAAGTEGMLAKLREAKNVLEEEIRCKMAAYKIDDQCRRLPQHMTPSHKKPKAVDYGKLVVSASEPGLGVDPLTGRRPRSTPSSPSAMDTLRSPGGSSAASPASGSKLEHSASSPLKTSKALKAAGASNLAAK